VADWCRELELAEREVESPRRIKKKTCKVRTELANHVKSSGMTTMGMTPFARALEMTERAAKRFDFSIIGIGLPLEKFEHLQNFFHVVQCVSKCLDDPIDLFDGHLDGGRRGYPSWSCWRQGRTSWRFQRCARFIGFSLLSRLNDLRVRRKSWGFWRNFLFWLDRLDSFRLELCGGW
jgi:hypothetical protein